MDSRLTAPFRALQLALGLTATLAGLDKFFNILADWGHYVSPHVAQFLPFSVSTFMAIVGVVEIAVGVAILAAAPRLGAYVASAWLLLVAVNLAVAGYFDVAVRDAVMSIAAFTLARGLEVRELAPALSFNASGPATRLATTLGLALAIGVGALTSTSAAELSPAPPEQPSVTPAAIALRQTMRTLWTDHVIWTRGYIVAAVGDQPDAPAAAARLMKNQEDIGQAVAGYYGKAAGDRLTALLKDHISIAVDIIKFAKAGDKAAQEQANAKWLRNAEDIADFLSKANPNWPRAVLVKMMNMHLSTTTDEVVARLTKNWEADTRAFDAVYEHILVMADALSDGIVKQFPEKFAGKI
jgi:peptidoglycan hydrolase-like protein with peptidoglycan-binding domain